MKRNVFWQIECGIATGNSGGTLCHTAKEFVSRVWSVIFLENLDLGTSVVSFGTYGHRIDRLTGMFHFAPMMFGGEGDIADFYAHCNRLREMEMRQEHASRLINALEHEAEWPASAVAWARVRTQYIPLYRIHSKRHFLFGPDFHANWAPDQRRLERHDRYSPPGTVGYYFGLTLKAAEDEARFYGGGDIDPSERMILVIECCVDDILYLTTVAIRAVWEAVGLEPVSSVEQYLRIMHNNTVNEYTDAIGVWARKAGFRGVIYPSARYGQEAWLKRRIAEGYHIVPSVNVVDMGSHLCKGNFPVENSLYAAADEIYRLGGLDRCVPIFAESNIVLFDERQITGERWGVVYQTFPLERREEVLAQDSYSRQAQSYVTWASDEQPPWIRDDDPPPYSG